MNGLGHALTSFLLSYVLYHILNTARNFRDADFLLQIERPSKLYNIHQRLWRMLYIEYHWITR